MEGKPKEDLLLICQRIKLNTLFSISLKYLSQAALLLNYFSPGSQTMLFWFSHLAHH